MVEDNGIGIDEMRLAKVFEPFWQEGNAFLAENTGVGLGLSIAKSYVEAQGGRIELKPAREHGTIFRIAMPLGAAAVAEPAGADMPAARSEEHTSELQSLMRISYAVFCLKKKTKTHYTLPTTYFDSTR